MQKQKVSFEDIYDIFAIRIVWIPGRSKRKAMRGGRTAW